MSRDSGAPALARNGKWLKSRPASWRGLPAQSLHAPAHARRDEAGVGLSALYSLRPILPIAMSPLAIADGCRDAALAFCRGVCTGWTKRELAAWLKGPYAAVAGLVDVSIAPPIDAPPPSTIPPAMGLLADDHIRSLLEPAWRSAMSCMDSLCIGDADRYVDEAFRRGSLVEALTVRGELMLVPMHRGRLRLAQRVQSLLLADYLHRADDYVPDAGYCEACGVFLLGAAARQTLRCAAHRRQSGIVLKDGPGVVTVRGGAAGAAYEAAIEGDEDAIDVDLSELG